MYVCVYVRMYVYVCMYVCVHVCMCVCTYVCVCMYVSNCAFVNACESRVMFEHGYIQQKVTNLFLILEFNHGHVKKQNSTIKLFFCLPSSHTRAFQNYWTQITIRTIYVTLLLPYTWRAEIVPKHPGYRWPLLITSNILLSELCSISLSVPLSNHHTAKFSTNKSVQ